MTTETVPATKRAAQIDAIHGFADWLARNPDMPLPTLSLHRHLQNDHDGTEAENLDTVRDLAASLAVGTDEYLDDRTVLRVKVNEHVWYELFAWHKHGRDNLGELERLRARIAELESTGLAYTRADSDGDDPTPVSPARVPPHTGGVEGVAKPTTIRADDGGVLVTDPACTPECDDMYVLSAPTGLDRSWHADNCPVWKTHQVIDGVTRCGMEVSGLPAAHGYSPDADSATCTECKQAHQRHYFGLEESAKHGVPVTDLAAR